MQPCSASGEVRSDTVTGHAVDAATAIVAGTLVMGSYQMTRKILIIDDDVGFTKAIEPVVKQLGLALKALNHSPDAVRVFEEYRPDIVLLDMIMPEKDGIDVLHEILMTGIPARIVLTSGFGAAYLRLGEGVARLHDQALISVLKKPFRRKELDSLLTRLIAEPLPDARD